MDPFIEWMIERRRDRGWTQAELGHRAGIHPNTISNWEREVCTPTITYIRWICTALGEDYVIAGRARRQEP